MTEVNIYTITNIHSFNEKSGTIGCLLAMCGTEKTRLHFKNVTATAKRAELKALIYALEHMKAPCKLTIYTESRYLVSGCTEWLSKWKSSDWHNAKQQEVRVAAVGRAFKATFGNIQTKGGPRIQEVA